VIDQRGRLLMAAVGFATCSMRSYDRALWALRTWLDSWPGVGHVAKKRPKSKPVQPPLPGMPPPEPPDTVRVFPCNSKSETN
jgi:hypothetical protein